MAYTPLQIKAGRQEKALVSTMGRKGLNAQDLPQMMSLDYCTVLNNYIPHLYGVEKRPGLSKVVERTGANPITLFQELTDNVWIIGYSTKVEIYDANTSTWYTAKSDFAAGGVYSGDRYGDYFFVTNGIERPGRVTKTLDYDGQTGNFTAGVKVTGATSGATATILEDSDAGATGTLTLGNISGTFANDEIIADTATGSATVNGVLTYTFTTVSSAPICGGFKVIGARMYAYRLLTDETAVQYSEVDTGANPPFTAWTTTTVADAGGSVSYRNAGAVRAIVQLGEYTVVFSDSGYYAFAIAELDQAGTLIKSETIQDYVSDYGGARGAISTPFGLFYLNEAGLWQMVAVGATNIEAARQQVLTSTLLGGKYFEDVDQSSCDLVYDRARNAILVTAAKDSATNNIIIGYKLELQAFFTFTNWNISRFAKAKEAIYGASSVKTTLYKLFEGSEDDGEDIPTAFEQELPFDGLYTAKKLLKFYVSGFLDPNSSISMCFSIYDLTGEFEENKKCLTWTASGFLGDYDEWGAAQWGGSEWGGSFNTAGLVESFAGAAPIISNFQRLKVKITNGDKYRHILNWFAAHVEQKAQIKHRNLTIT